MARVLCVAKSVWQPWVALLFLASAKPGAGVRAGQDELLAEWRHAALQPKVPGAARSKESDAQFLIQATFGPKLEELRELEGKPYEDWIREQMDLPLELHRSYYRQRANPRQATPLSAGLVRPRCAAGSRWHRFAVERADRDKRLEVRGGQLLVDGELRAHIDPSFVGNGLRRPDRCSNVPLEAWRNSRGVFTRNCATVTISDCSSQAFAQQGACAQACFDLAVPLADTADNDLALPRAVADCSTGWVNLQYEGFVCDVVDAIGGLLRLSSEANCKGTMRVMRNPAVWLSRQPSSTAPLRFEPLRRDVLLLAESPAKCDLGDIAQVGRGHFARYSARLELLENTPEVPAALPGTAAALCPTVRRNPFNMDACRVQPACLQGSSKVTQHYEVCGSPGEVANVPREGHWYSFHSHRFDDMTWNDEDFDLPNGRSPRTSRVNVWFQRATDGKDQLRQRMAWALSQIFVVGEDNKNLVEGNLAFYDIFVRHAFGNFLDVLREVTYSPMMGHYLTYLDNNGFHVQGTYPDENYAREVMQLFSIGLWQLHPNGTRQRSTPSSEGIPTYNNLHIQNFARVFTGFTYERHRGNTEHFFGLNYIDPMRMVATDHDFLPKTDLGDGYLGDGYPLCSDLPATAFLRKGARFEFAGFQRPSGLQDSEILKVGAAWPLHRALCQAPASNPCEFQTVVELQGPVACAQCKNEAPPRYLLVGGGYYEYVPPPCVHIFFRQCWRQQWSRNCRLTVAVDADGLVVEQPADPSRTPFPGRFPVQWAGGADGVPAPSDVSCPQPGCALAGGTCVCSATVETAAAFPSLPSKEDVARTLRIGAFPPAGPCTVCRGPVRAYSASGRIDSNTVFEVDGRFWLNLRSTVRVGSRTFRNPPSFMQERASRDDDLQARTREALNEVEAFLDLLARHPNTPVFTSYRLIQRFGNSNPSARYMEDVVQAFTTGTYAGRNFSGRYGDLGATLAAVLLHPEARANVAREQGALREPLLKLVHVLRSLEYSGRSGRPIFVHESLADTGEEPMQSPSVFNFYNFNFQPSAFLADSTLRTLMAPEYQIMDSAQLVTSINGLLSTLENFGLSHCDGGFGVRLSGVSLSALPSLERLSACQQGDFLAMRRLSASAPDEALRELSLLLTGGRLSQASTNTVRDFAKLPPGERAPTPSEKLNAAQKAILFTAEFNSVGGRVGSSRLPLPAASARAATTTTTPRPPRSYRALVQLYLNGGADTFQLIVPLNCKLYDEYESVRKNIRLAPEQLLQVTTPNKNQGCGDFGIHNKLGFLRDLYVKGEAAFVSNVGNLVEPLLDRQDFLTGGKRRCAGLFSHEDQSKGAQTLLCQSSGASAQLGAGGRLADALATGKEKYRTASFSIAGNAAWSDAYEVKPSTLSPYKGVVRISDLGSLQSMISNITARAYEGIYGNIYARGLADTVRQSEELGGIVEKATLRNKRFPTSTPLQQQLRQVALLIASRAERRAERDLFFVRLLAFDAHKKVNSKLNALFSEVDGALQAFVTELKDQRVWDSTVLFTASDFGRTLSPNDNGADAGTDHGWAGNHVVMGGAIRGGRVLNDFPSTLRLGSAMDVGRGRLIPKYPLENYMVPVSLWMGLADDQLDAAFPNLANFKNRSAHILPMGELFEG